MEIEGKIFWTAGIITLVIFSAIYLISEVLNYERETKLDNMRIEVLEEIENMKAFSAITTLLEGGQSCKIFQTQLKYFDRSVWDLGKKLDSYRQASKNLVEDPFYLQQKKSFMVNQILYLSIHEKMKSSCESSLPLTIIYFYGNSTGCHDCDAQSFVLTDINKDIDTEISIFSLDTDIDIMATKILYDYYNVTELPCTVVAGEPYCGLKNRNEMIKVLCTKEKLTVC